MTHDSWFSVVVSGKGYFAMSFFYRLPDNSNRKQSYTIDDGNDTTLGREFKVLLDDHPGKTGVFLLPNGRDAFAARALLVRASEKSLDIQYYMYYHHTVGGLLTFEVIKAADRGVRVRMLIDDICGDQDEDVWIGLDAHENIEVRMWNPWKRGGNRLIQSVVRASEIDYRMHAKSFTVDNQATVLGGRNIGDAYFGASEDISLADIDVLSIGPPVREVSNEFDSYWNAAHAYPINILVRHGTAQDLTDLRSRKATFFDANSTSGYIKALTNSALAKGLKNGSLAFSWADTRVIHDSPMKMDLKKTGENELLISQLAPYILNAKKTVDIASPYFVPGEKATQALCKLSQDGVQVRILTNSLASNDVSAVHAAYSRYRSTLLRCGVRLFELDESLKIREAKMLPWLPGLSKSGLHAKLMIFDRQIMFIGSFNFDQRSLNINNEIGLLFHEPEVAGAAAKRFEENVNKIAFEVRLISKGCRKKLQWTGGQGGPAVVMQKEPYATTMQKLTVSIVKWLPVLDSQL